jgi:hypothetical protein
MQRNGQKRDDKSQRKKMIGKNNPCKKFLTWAFSQKHVRGVFELPSLRNAQKNHTKNSPQKLKERKQGTYLPIYTPHSVAICQIYVAFNFVCVFSLSAPALHLAFTQGCTWAATWVQLGCIGGRGRDQNADNAVARALGGFRGQCASTAWLPYRRRLV